MKELVARVGRTVAFGLVCVTSCAIERLDREPTDGGISTSGADSSGRGGAGSGGTGGQPASDASRAGASGSGTTLDASRVDATSGTGGAAMDAGRGGAGGPADVRADIASGGTAGASGSGGTSGAGGTGGAGGAGGVSGAGGKGGSGGASGAGGVSGTGGASGSGGAAGAGGASGTGGNAGSGGTGGTCTPDANVYTGHITYYTLSTSMVACHFPTASLPQYYAAMNEYDYRNAAACGTCVEITNSQNQSKLTVQVVDECPFVGNEQWCFSGSHHVDLNTAAYNALGANNNPQITWRYAPCNATVNSGNVQYFWDSGTQQFYLAVTIMNTRHELSKVEIMKNGSYVAMTRQRYNVWTDGGGVGTGPFTFRLTDKYGHQIIDANIPMNANQVVAGHVQFPVCP
jgi:expansin (peptidoglycan-binding protein)